MRWKKSKLFATIAFLVAVINVQAGEWKSWYTIEGDQPNQGGGLDISWRSGDKDFVEGGMIFFRLRNRHGENVFVDVTVTCLDKDGRETTTTVGGTLGPGQMREDPGAWATAKSAIRYKITSLRFPDREERRQQQEEKRRQDAEQARRKQEEANQRLRDQQQQLQQQQREAQQRREEMERQMAELRRQQDDKRSELQRAQAERQRQHDEKVAAIQNRAQQIEEIAQRASDNIANTVNFYEEQLKREQQEREAKRELDEMRAEDERQQAEMEEQERKLRDEESEMQRQEAELQESERRARSEEQASSETMVTAPTSEPETPPPPEVTVSPSAGPDKEQPMETVESEGRPKLGLFDLSMFLPKRKTSEDEEPFAQKMREGTGLELVSQYAKGERMELTDAAYHSLFDTIKDEFTDSGKTVAPVAAVIKWVRQQPLFAGKSFDELPEDQRTWMAMLYHLSKFAWKLAKRDAKGAVDAHVDFQKDFFDPSLEDKTFDEIKSSD